MLTQTFINSLFCHDIFQLSLFLAKNYIQMKHFSQRFTLWSIFPFYLDLTIVFVYVTKRAAVVDFTKNVLCEDCLWLTSFTSLHCRGQILQNLCELQLKGETLGRFEAWLVVCWRLGSGAPQLRSQRPLSPVLPPAATCRPLRCTSVRTVHSFTFSSKLYPLLPFQSNNHWVTTRWG